MRIEHIRGENFSAFGRVIEYPQKIKGQKGRNLFRRVIVERRRLGWRIAYLVVRDRFIRRLESHPDSFESFEPVCGRSLIYVADKKDRSHIRCFYLDKPICLHKGVWHGIITLDGEAEIKITENASVRCNYWPFGFRLPE